MRIPNESEFSNNNDAVRDKKERPATVPLLYGGFDSVKEVADALIRKHHDHLATANIIFVCRNKEIKSGGRILPGKVSIPNALYKYLTMDALATQNGFKAIDHDELPQANFIIEVATETWNPASPDRRIAMIDHLLARCVGEEDPKSGEMKWSMRPPQVQEFPEVAERNGAWNDELGEMKDCLRDDGRHRSSTNARGNADSDEFYVE